MNNQDLYFKDKAAKYMFTLTEIDGKVLLNLLGINYEHYSEEDFI